MKSMLELLNLLDDLDITLSLDKEMNLSIKGDKNALTPELVSEIKHYKSKIVETLKANLKKDSKQVIPVATRVAGGMPLSFAQQRLWVLDQLGGGSVHYNMPSTIQLNGNLDIVALKKSFSSIFERHEVLRTSYGENAEGQAVQIIHPVTDVEISLTDISELSKAEREAELRRLVQQEASLPFDLTHDAMLRIQLLRLSSQEHVLLVTMHHIASDGWSMGILINEFGALYKAYVDGDNNPFPPLDIQYTDYAHWQREWLQGAVLEEQMGYWEQHLAGIPQVHSMPLDRTRPKLQSFVGATHQSFVDTDILNKLNRLCRESGCTLFMGLQTAFSVLISRYSRETDIVIGTSVANREQSQIANLIGFFVNALVLRSDLSGNPSFSTSLKQSKSMLLDAYMHQQIPFEQVVERLQPERSLSHSPLFQIMLLLQNFDKGSLELPGITLSPVEQSDDTVKYDLTVRVTESEDALHIAWVYRKDLFDQKTIEALACHFNTLLSRLVDTPTADVFALDILSPEEKHQQLVEWNQTAAEYPRERCVHELFEQQVASSPDATAIIFEDEQLSYRELNQRANQLAHYLVEQRNVTADSLVGICVERSVEMVVGILAILKAGAAYVPLDPDYPQARLSYMLTDADLNTVLIPRYLLEKTGINDNHALCLDDANLTAQLSRSCIDNLGKGIVKSSHLAYVIYTSGSTGKPKGVMVEHQALHNRIHWMHEQYGCSSNDKILQKTPFSFDVSVWEFFWPLTKGAQLVIAAPQGHKDPAYLSHLIQSQGITKLHFVPSMLNQVLEHKAFVQCTSLKQVFCSGEALQQNQVETFAKCLPDTELHNLYGPTEAAIDVTYWQCDPNNIHEVPIGRPINNIQLYVLQDMALVPAGVSGELYIGGDGLARGYLNRPELAAEKFVANPFHDPYNPYSSQRLYKTGDLVRYLPDGNLAYLGRLDDQVKLRGFRIELGEIAHQLSQHEEVNEALVVVPENDRGERQLVAYVVHDNALTMLTENGQALQQQFIASLKESLDGVLPDYMVPSAFVVLAEFPVTHNGKLDRKRLPAPDMSQQQQEYVAPESKTEQLLCDIWQEVLGVERVGVTDNFFDLGGHSLLALRVINKLQSYLEQIIQLVVIFDIPTIRELSQYLQQNYLNALISKELVDASAPELSQQANRELQDTDFAQIAKLVPQLPNLNTISGRKNQKAVFILSPHRSGSTLLRVMLAGHQQLFAPPELELLAFNDLQQRKAAFSDRFSFYLEGTLRAIIEAKGCDLAEAESIMNSLEQQGLSIHAFYAQLQEWIGSAILVEKTPTYAYHPDILQAMELMFEDAHYIHLVRHPYGMVTSFEEAKLNEVVYLENNSYSATELGELLWTESHSNISSFLSGIPEHRQHRVSFEDLTRDPKQQMVLLCQFLGIDFDEGLLTPYSERSQRMSDGVRKESRMLGDVKFHQHKKIDSGIADSWKNKIKQNFLHVKTWRIAQDLSYDRKMEQNIDLLPIKKVAHDPEGYPLSFAQQRLWFIDRMEDGSPEYNMKVALRVEGAFDTNVAETAISQLVLRHQPLRTIYDSGTDEPRQFLRSDWQFELGRFDLTQLEPEEQQEKVEQLILEDSAKVFDLSTDLMVRASYIKLAEGETDSGVLLFCMHHIAGDGWSTGVLVNEFVAQYKAALNGAVDPLAPLEVQYVDYSVWQRDWLQSGAMDKQLQYWEQQLADMPVVHSLPLKNPRPTYKQYDGATVKGQLSSDISQSLKKMAIKYRVTPFILLHAAVGLILSRHSNSTDIVLGTPFANRVKVELEPLIGFFVNTLILRVNTKFKHFVDYLKHVRDVNLEAQTNQNVPFEQLVDHCNIPRNTQHTPLFQIMLSMNTNETGDLDIPGTHFSLVEGGKILSKFDMDIEASILDEGVFVTWTYDKSLFTQSYIEKLNHHLEILLTGLSENIDTEIKHLPFLSDDELQSLVKDFNTVEDDSVALSTIHSAFEQNVAATPHEVAVSFEQQQLSYQQLNVAANQLTHYLVEQGVQSETLVAIYMDRSMEMIIAILAVLKAGGAYVPIDFEYPKARVDYILQDTELAYCLTQSDLKEDFPATENMCVIAIDAPENQVILQVQKQTNPALSWQQSPSELAYIIYTSGTSGKPKGVMGEHGGLYNLGREMSGWSLSDNHKAWGWTASYSFDASLQSIMQLCMGRPVAILPTELKKQPEKLIQWVQTHNVGVMDCTPSMVALWFSLGLKESLPNLLIGGEPISKELWAELVQWQNGVHKAWNVYGLTEASVNSTFSRIAPAELPHIGKPLGNVQVYLLDEQQLLAPQGTIAELYIGGVGLARGYFKNSELTEQRFVANPFSDKKGERLLRTGDLARYLPDGNIEYLGRIDEQVKLRGFRIELGEIESIIQQYNGVENALVLTQQSASDSQSLVAYVRPDEALITHFDGCGNSERLDEWQDVFDDAYTRNDDNDTSVDQETDSIGWDCSYRSTPIPAEEMQEWIDGTIATIASLRPRRVLEIGVGSGMLLYRYAENCEQVCATDISQQALQKVSQGVQRKDWQHIQLKQGRAHDLSDFEGMEFDTVILNSVAQYFPSKSYFLLVLEEIFKHLAAGGKVMLGDLRNADLLDAYATSVALYQDDKDLDLEEIKHKALLATFNDEELLFSPTFFAELPQQFSDIAQVDILVKSGIYTNEMMRYRYDVVLHKSVHSCAEVAVGGTSAERISESKSTDQEPLRWYAWQGLAELAELLRQHSGDCLGVYGCVNQRIDQDLALISHLKEQRAVDLQEFRQHISLTENLQLEEVTSTAKALGYDTKITWSQQSLTQLDFIFIRENSAAAPCIQAFAPYQARVKTNTPQLRAVSRNLIPELKAHLEAHLPEFMLPSSYLLMDRFPQTINGKIDKTAFPRLSLVDSGNYVAAETAIEEQLQGIWQTLLNNPAISIDANFFESGGDSILSIQLVSRAAKLGLHFTVKDVFSAQTIRKLALLAKSDTNNQVDQSPVEGDISLLPIQHSFFSNPTDLHHFNQSVFLTTPRDFNRNVLKQIVAKLYERHDALRLKFYQQDGVWKGNHIPVDDDMVEEAIVCKQLDSFEPQNIEDFANQIQTSLDPRQGRLFRAAYLSGDKGEGRLLLVIHHLVVDGVSWRIILEDLESLYQQIQDKVELKLAPKGCSYQQWTQVINEYAQSAELARQKNYWQGIMDVSVADFQAVSESKIATSASQQEIEEGSVDIHLEQSTTEQLLSGSHQAYSTKINELLLSGLLLAAYRWSDSRAIRIDMEGHGREMLQDNVDLSQTVGWFTSLYPVALEIDKDNIADLICGVKEHYRAIPDNGIGFGVLRYLTENTEINAQTSTVVKQSLHSELVFNYLGQFDQVVSTDTAFGIANEPSGQNISSARQRVHPMLLNGMVVEGCLRFNLSFDRDKYHQVAMQELMQLFEQALQEVVEHCASVERKVYTPSDFPLASISANDLQQWQIDERVKALYPASGIQQGMLFHSMMESGSYVTQTVVKIKDLNVEIFKQAWSLVLQRHDVFRTAFVGLDSGNVHQVIYQAAELTWQMKYLNDLPHDKLEQEVESIRLADKRRDFDPSVSPLMRMTLIDLGDAHHQLIWSHHHALMDGWCLPLIFNEVTESYRALICNEQLPPVTSPSYQQYIEWTQQQDLEKAKLFWRQQLQAIEHKTPLPLEKNTEQLSSSANSYQEIISFTTQESAQIIKLAQNAKTTINIVVQAAWALLLSRYSNQSTVVFGGVTSGRPASIPDVEKIIGIFINTLPVVVNVDSELQIGTWLQKLHGELVERESFSYLPLHEIQQQSAVTQGLFDSLMVFENYPLDNALGSKLVEAELNVTDQQSFEEVTYGIMVQAHMSEYLAIGIKAHQDRVDCQAISQIARHLKHIISQLIHSIDCKVQDIKLLDASEVQQQLSQFNGNCVDYQEGRFVHQWFESNASEQPDAIAITCADVQLSYGQLNRQANQLAHYLIEHRQVKPDSLVGICMERSADFVTAVLAVLKAGGAYVPLQPDYPQTRLDYIIGDAQLSTVITNRAAVDTGLELGSGMICLDSESIKNTLSTYADYNPAVVDLRVEHLAYMIYTSGSTGQPKGVMQTHNTLSRLLQACELSGEITAPLRTSCFTSVAFDVSVQEIMTALYLGAELVIASHQNKYSLQGTVDFLLQNRIERFFATPQVLHLLAEECQRKELVLTALREVVVAGDALVLSDAINNFLSVHHNLTLWNHYGPTETHVVTTSKVNMNGPANVSIGKPLAGIHCYVTDENLALLPMGMAGELCISGPCLTRGYINQPELTQSKLLENPFYQEGRSECYKKLYRSGDLVRWLPDGNLEYVGRIDSQVKIRGFRIELGEIESRLLAHHEVANAVVIAKEQASGGKTLIAYVVPQQFQLDNALQQNFARKLRSALVGELPDYMIPSAFVQLDKLPLTANGKLEHSKLQVPDFAQQQTDYVAPSTATEKILCDIWQDVLELERVGISDNFFELGGHSLLLMQVIAKLQDAGYTVSARQLFTLSTLSDLAVELDASDVRPEPVYTPPENLIPDGCENITPDMLPLIDLSELEIARIADTVPGGMQNIKDIYPLGPLQQGILFTHMHSDLSDPYVLPSLYALSNKTALDEFIGALEFIINRYDVFRTAILWQGLREPVQVVYRQSEPAITWLTVDGDNALQHMHDLCAPEQQNMDISQGPLIKVRITQGESMGSYLALLQYHHIISDHVTLDIISRELSIFGLGQTASLPSAIPYRDFIAHTLHQQKQTDPKKFFSELLGDIEEPTLPFGFVDIRGDRTQIEDKRAFVPQRVNDDIRYLAKSLQISPAVLFHCAWAMVLGACSGKDDVVFGTVMSGRLQGAKGTQDMPGVFINTLPARVRLADYSFIGLVRQVKGLLNDLLPYEQTPLATAQSYSGLGHDVALFSSLLNYRHVAKHEEVHDVVQGETSIQVLTSYDRNTYPLSVSVNDQDDTFSFDVQIEAGISADRIIIYMNQALENVVEVLLTKPEQSLANMSVLPPEEKHQQLVEWNQTAAEYPRERCVHELFEQQVASSPDATAIIFEDEQLSYRELNQRANQLAHYLVEQRNVTADSLVGICVERSVEMVVGILAILKAGAAYVPLDPDYPQARLSYMLTDADLNTVLIPRYLLEKTGINDNHALCLDDANLTAQLSRSCIDNLGKGIVKSSHLAYVIYTSGSTGKPKGVMVEHQALHNRIHWMHEQYGCSSNDKILQKTPFSFDVSVWEFFWPLTKGAQLVIAAPQGHKDPAYLSHLIQSQGITKLHFVPSMLNQVLEHKAFVQCTSLKQVFCSGEALQQNQVETFAKCLPDTELHNLYGPTEAAIDVTYWQCDPNNIHEVPIGRPINNIQLYVLQDMALVPAGVSGELYIGGDGLARGYLNRPELAAEKFVANPFHDPYNPYSSQRLYKTGDLVRYLPDGNLAYLGRLDDQVKLRGFRIELGEIAHQLSQHEEVNEALVVVPENDRGERQLVAYVVHDNALTMLTENGQALQQQFIASLKESLDGVLPDYMVPSAFVVLAEFPVTHNGKLDRKRLPAPDMSQQQQEYVAPESKTEQLLCDIWQEVLGVERVGVTDNFFALGGHSLVLIRLLTKVNEAFDISLDLNEVLNAQTVEVSAKVIDSIIVSLNLQLEDSEESSEEDELII